MKTLNHTLRTILFALALFGTGTTATAYGIKVNGIYYNINGDNATVTYQNRNSYYDNYGNQYYKYYNDNKGYVIIPETITLDGKTYTVTAIGDYAFCHTDSEGISGISFPNTITSIGMYAFQNCDKLLEITIPESVTSIGEGAFYDCDYISNITIPNSVTTINNQAFCYCDRLKSAVIGKYVSSIGANAFASSLKYITCLATTPPSSTGDAPTSAKLYVPLESVELYRTTSGWHLFTDVRGFGENYFSMPDVTTFHGDTIVIPVTMENADEITAFQTDIYLPEGFELMKDGGDYLMSLSIRKGRDHVIMANEMPDGSVRVLSYSPTLKTYSGNDGELFYLTVKVPDNGDGNYRLELNNTIVTTIEEEEVHALNAFNNIKVFAYTLGDVDGNGEITVADIVQAARYILNYNPESFIFDAADINGDGKISITDVVKIAHLVLDADYDDPGKKMNAPAGNDNIMGGDLDKDSHNVSITLKNDEDYTAFQLDLTLPAWITASDFELAERAKGLGLIVKDRGDGKVRVLGYTADLKTIDGNEGTLLTFDVTGHGEILVSGIELVTPEGKIVHPGSFTIKKGQFTTIKEIEGSKVVDHIDYYNLAGQRIDRPESGVNLVVTTYSDGARTTTKLIK